MPSLTVFLLPTSCLGSPLAQPIGIQMPMAPPEGVHACQPPGAEGGARKGGDWMGEHSGAPLAEYPLAVLRRPSSATLGHLLGYFAQGRLCFFFVRRAPDKHAAIGSARTCPRPAALPPGELVGGDTQECSGGGSTVPGRGLPSSVSAKLAKCLMPQGIKHIHFWTFLCKEKCEYEPQKTQLAGKAEACLGEERATLAV